MRFSAAITRAAADIGQSSMSLKHDADVIVAGAGPAGATAALRLARAGVRVLVLERYPLPRQKPCGGGISTRVFTRFPWLPDAFRGSRRTPVSSLYLEGPSGDVFRMQTNGPAVLLIRRIEFDYLLASMAREAGAAILDAAADRAGPPGRGRRHAADARGARAARADGDRRGRRQQRHRAASRHEPGLAGRRSSRST